MNRDVAVKQNNIGELCPKSARELGSDGDVITLFADVRVGARPNCRVVSAQSDRDPPSFASLRGAVERLDSMANNGAASVGDGDRLKGTAPTITTS